jgi:HK97 family phage prohead protease
MPEPRARETEDEWIARCMSDQESIDTHPDEDQRFAVCMSKWEGAKAEGYKPTQAMADVARRALEWRREYGRGGTEVGVARARNIANRDNLSSETVARMRSFFGRHGVNRSRHYDREEGDGGPTAFRIAWDLWGGDEARTWADNIGERDKGNDMTIHHKSVALDLKREPDDDGMFEGYASVFGVVDQGMDVVERGAFAKSLGTGRKVKMLWQHDQAQPIGVFDKVEEDERGLYVRGRLLKEVAKGREAMALLRAGAIDSMSIGYRVMDAAPEGDGMVRRLKEIDLHEISLVTFPMLPDAKVTAIKSIETERDFERFLRDAGFSRKQAVAIALHGFKSLKTEAREAPDVSELVEKIANLRKAISQ